MILVFASGLAIKFTTKRKVAWVLYTFGLTLAIGSRQLSVLLFLWLPLALWFGRAHRGIIARSILLGLIAIGLNVVVTLYLCSAFRVPYHTTLGRTLSDRIDTFLAQLSPEERSKIAGQLADQTNDSETRKAIHYQADTGPYYAGMGVSDEAVLSSSLLYLKTLHPALLAIIGKDFWRGLCTNNRNIALGPFFSNRWGAKEALTHPQYWTGVKGYPSLEPGRAESIWAKARSDRYVKLWQNVPLFLVAALTIVLCVVKRDIQTLWLLGFGACLFLANMVCVYYSDRYVLNLFIPLVVAFSVASVSPLPKLSSGKRKPREP